MPCILTVLRQFGVRGGSIEETYQPTQRRDDVAVAIATVPLVCKQDSGVEDPGGYGTELALLCGLCDGVVEGEDEKDLECACAVEAEEHEAGEEEIEGEGEDLAVGAGSRGVDEF